MLGASMSSSNSHSSHWSSRVFGAWVRQVSGPTLRADLLAGLLGTVFTMTNTFFKTPFEDRGIQVSVPSDSQIARIQTKIETELEHGIVKEDTRQEFEAIIRDLKQREGIDHIVLACTELPLILSDDNSPVPCLDTVEIHVESLIRAVISG